ncbi:MAG: hypothetical protein DMG49_16855 [Acidobacteria bacterium]|nr:MAG: hypothetical protein DMG49_16855 [Acidobacteriota bacterium]
MSGVLSNFLKNVFRRTTTFFDPSLGVPYSRTALEDRGWSKLAGSQPDAPILHAGETMRLEELRSRLRGVIAFPVTPFKPDLSFAIVAAGGRGEMCSFTPSEHEEVVKGRVDEVREVRAMKAMMNLTGLAGEPTCPPLPNLRPEEVAEVKSMLEWWRPVLE